MAINSNQKLLTPHEKPLGMIVKQCIHFLFSKQKIKLLSLVFIIIFTGIIPSIDSIFLQQLTDTIENYSDLDLESQNLAPIILKWILIYGIWWEGQNIILRIYDYAYLKIMPQIKAQVVDEIYNYIQFHCHNYFQENLAGDIANRVTEASRSLEMIYAFTSEKIIRKLAIIIFAIITLFLVHKSLLNYIWKKQGSCRW
jgi:ATP-binding cassette, subfamily B, bacterial